VNNGDEPVDLDLGEALPASALAGPGELPTVRVPPVDLVIVELP
jgi:hypothetical protein